MAAGPGERGGVVVGLLVAVALLVGLAAVADRVAASFAQQAIAQRLQSAAKLSQAPAVTITGWPFLTQLAAHDLTRVDVAAADYQAGPMLLRHVRFQLFDAWRGGNTITARRVTGTVDVALAELQRLAGNRATFSAGADGLHFTASARGLRASGTAAVTVVGNVIRITPRPAATTTPVLPSIDVPVPKLPWGIAVTGVSVTSEGLTLSASAKDVDLQRP